MMIESYETNNFVQEIVNLNTRAFGEYEAIGREFDKTAEQVLLSGEYTSEITGNEVLKDIAHKAQEVLEMVGWLPAPGVKKDDVYSILLLLNDLTEKYDVEMDKINAVDAEIQELLKSHNLHGLSVVLQREGVPFENTEDGVIEAARNKIRSWELPKLRKAFDP